MDGMVDAKEWAVRQWGTVTLGDSRRQARAVDVGACMLCRSNESLPNQMDSWNRLRAAYRLLNSPHTTHAAVSLPHWEATVSEARRPGLGVVLFIQDGTELNYTSHPSTSGLGFIGGSEDLQGMELHTCLAVVASDQPLLLGMARSALWTRDHTPRAKVEKRSVRNARHKESDLWGDMVEAIGPAPSADSGTRWVSVGDRGSDLFSFLSRSLALGWSCLVRSKHDRNIEDSSSNKGRLQQYARSLSPADTFSLTLRTRPGKPAQTVTLRLAWAPVRLMTPHPTKGGAIEAWCIRVWEEGGPLEWILVSTDPVETLDDAHQKVEWYHHRWLIEEYHKCLKTGCAIEKRQLTTAQGLKALTGFLGVIAVFLLQLKTAQRPLSIPEQLKFALSQLTKRQLENATPHEIWRSIAMLGGFLGRKGDGEPGWRTTWSGWNRLLDIAIGIEIGRALAET